MKTILLLVHDDAGQEARLQAALDVGRAVEGHLSCLDVTVVPALVGTDYVGDAGFGLLLDDEREREAANRTKMEARLAHEDLPWDWTNATGQIAQCLENACALSDLIVVNRQLDAFPLPDMRTIAGELLLHADAPILAVPDTLERFDLDSALVAWDGSNASAVALRAAVPLLRLARRVTIVEVGNRVLEWPAEDAATYLSRYDIHASIKRLESSDRPVADVLLDKAASQAFGYVVMGGFGHRRFVETLLGGVTRTMLAKSPIPVLLAH